MSSKLKYTLILFVLVISFIMIPGYLNAKNTTYNKMDFGNWSSYIAENEQGKTKVRYFSRSETSEDIFIIIQQHKGKEWGIDIFNKYKSHEEHFSNVKNIYNLRIDKGTIYNVKGKVKYDGKVYDISLNCNDLPPSFLDEMKNGSFLRIKCENEIIKFNLDGFQSAYKHGQNLLPSVNSSNEYYKNDDEKFFLR